MDKRLKQRLIGATVLVILAIIIIPELLKESPQQRKPVVTTEMPPRPQEPESPSLTISLPSVRPPEPVIPEHPSVTEQSTRMPEHAPPLDQPDSIPTEKSAQKKAPPQVSPKEIPQPPQPSGAAITPRPPAEPPEPTPPASRPPESSPAEPVTAAKATGDQAPQPSPQLPKLELIARSSGAGYTSSKPASSPETGKVPARPATRSGWGVQVGSFSVEENAYQLRNRLHARGYPVLVERVVVNGRTLHRVQVGPQASRAESEITLERLRREAGIAGQVVSLDN